MTATATASTVTSRAAGMGVEVSMDISSWLSLEDALAGRFDGTQTIIVKVYAGNMGAEVHVFRSVAMEGRWSVALSRGRCFLTNAEAVHDLAKVFGAAALLIEDLSAALNGR